LELAFEAAILFRMMQTLLFCYPSSIFSTAHARFS